MEKFPDLNNYAHIHFVGIGGVSMSSLASILAGSGKKVTGSDSNDGEKIDELRSKGIEVHIGHNAKNAEGAQLVVYTAAVKDDNPELVYAKQNGIPMIERAVLLGMLMATYKYSVAVAGTHGKTTTTSMISSVFMSAGLDPTVHVGGHLSMINGNYRVGASEYAVYEACEYVNSFHHFYPNTAVILNIDADHLDFFKNIGEIRKSFTHFMNNVDDDGHIIINGDDENCDKALKSLKGFEPLAGKVLTFGFNKTDDCYADNIRYDHGKACFDAVFQGSPMKDITLSVPGKHNVLNALAAVCCGVIYGLKEKEIKEGLSAFTGADRRFQKVGNVNGADIIDDYAHHPTEITATLRSAKAAGYDKVTVVFQPHTFTRTKLLQKEFINALKQADQLIMTDIYSAREINTIGANVLDIVSAIDGARYISSKNDIADYIKENAHENEVFILMGAGDVNKIADLLN